MSTKFKDLVKLKKAELQKIASHNDINYSSTTKRAELIEKICSDLTSKKQNLLALGSDGVKAKAKEYDVEYTTKKETLSKIAEKINQENSQHEKEQKDWREEFEKAIGVAKRNTLSEKRSYKILATDEENTFNVRPTYMKHPEEYNLMLTINITEYAKEML